MNINWTRVYYGSCAVIVLLMFVIMGQGQSVPEGEPPTQLNSLTTLAFFIFLVITVIAGLMKNRTDNAAAVQVKPAAKGEIEGGKSRVLIFAGFIVLVVFIFMFTSSSGDGSEAGGISLINLLIIGLPLLIVGFFALRIFGTMYFYRLLERGNYERAKQILRFLPNSQEQRAMLYRLQGDYETAIELLTKQIQHPSAGNVKLMPMLYQQRGLAYQEWGQPENAIQDYNEALRLQPENLSLVINLSSAYVEDRRFDEAQNLLETTLQKAQRPVERSVIYTRLADLWWKMGDAAKTLDYSQKAESETLTADESRYIKAMTAIRSGEIELAGGNESNAYTAFQRAYEFLPENTFMMTWFAVISARQGNLDEARSVWDKLVERNPRYHDAAWVRSINSLPDSVAQEVGLLAG